MNNIKVQPGSHPADEKYHITIMETGPYLVYGSPPMNQYLIEVDEDGVPWDFRKGAKFKMDTEPVAICRCGVSHQKPYCDGSHVTANWDPTLTASNESLLDGSEVYPGPRLSLSDNIEYCVFARFCDAKGRVWNLVGQSDDPRAAKNTEHEANMCPGGRLSAWDNSTGTPIEPRYEPSLGLIQDTPLAISGGFWVRGGIPVSTEDGKTYEIRNRVVLCRCGQASNKPFCDGTHASMKFRDGLSEETKHEALVGI